MRRGLFPLAKTIARSITTSEAYGAALSDLKRRPQNRHVGDTEYISLEASTPRSPAENMSDLMGRIISESFRRPYCFAYRNRSMEGVDVAQAAAMTAYESDGFETDGCRPIFTSSIHQVLHLVLDRALDHQKDKILMPIPSFGLFFDSIRSRGFKTGFAELDESTQFRMTPDILKNTLEQNLDARMFILINPDNLTGVVYNKEELDGFAKVFVEHNAKRREKGLEELVVFSDEASNRVGPIISDLKVSPHPSFGACKGVKDFTITTRSLSKTLAPSLGVCYAIGPDRLIGGILNSSDNILANDFGPNYPTQVLFAELLTTELPLFREHIIECNKQYSNNLGKVLKFEADVNRKMSKIFGCDKFCKVAVIPKGGLQCFIQFPELLGCRIPGSDDVIRNDIDLAEYLIREKKVGILPAMAFGLGLGERKSPIGARVTISKDPSERLEAGLLRIQDAIRDFTPERRVRDDISLLSAKKLLSEDKTKMSKDDINLR